MSELKIEILDNEYWWGGSVNQGYTMPYHKGSTAVLSMTGGYENDQFAPLLLSSKGRYIWSEDDYVTEFKDGKLFSSGAGEITLCEGFENLRGAYLAAMKAHFPFTGTLPDADFFRMPQYNTWMELGANQTTEGILEYARGILANGLPAGILMIDGGWQEDYGIYDEFNRRRIPDPKALTDELHRMGFKVMVWASPIVSSAGTRYKMLRDANYLVRQADGEPAVRKWWSGYSAVMDYTNPEAVEWQYRMLDSLMERYGVDGFKFDAGDAYFYQDDDLIFRPMSARHQTAEFNRMGVRYPLNEFRAAWKFGGQPIVSRLHDKNHSWDHFGMNTLIPHTLLQGLLGYAYCCPDMVGGGMYGNLSEGGFRYDEELFVRWAQANAFMGMMQVSRSPWKALSPEASERVKKAILLHAALGETIYAIAEETAKTGEPITRHMAYMFPDEGYETVNDMFMLGDRYLVAPVVTKGCTERDVRLPKGSWKYADGTVYEGGQTVTIAADIDTIPYFTKA